MTSRTSQGRPAPELLAPAGNWECVHAAVENGADAIYFGLESGFNARARAVNFSLDDLPRLMAHLHRRGVSGFVTLNTLIFTDELRTFEQHVRELAAAGVDAVLVQDLGAVRLIHEICPELSVHASTQMTMTAAETIAAIDSLGIDRVVLGRECSLDEIRKITSATAMPVETFVHGALCVAYSGQCLTSESLGGRSANRGQCAQACRLDYQLISDGKDIDLGDVKYLLSPQDLAAYECIPDLIDAGVASLKIEGRLKSPEYVANIVHHYRQAIDAAMLGERKRFTVETQREMELSFSRGFSPGWLEGCNHKRLVPGRSSSKRGVLVGRLVRKKGDRVVVDLDAPLSKGDGLVFEGDRAAGTEVGGRIFQILVNHRPAEQAVSGRVELEFQRGLIRDAELYEGQSIWQTDAPKQTKAWRQTFASERFLRKLRLNISGRVQVGEPLEFQVVWSEQREGISQQDFQISVTSDHVPERAHEHGARIYLATLRILKAGEAGLFRALEKHSADGWLVRNLAALRYAVDRGIRADCDFSLNVTNPLTAQWLMEAGAGSVTASYDLNRVQLLELVAAMRAESLEVVIHQHMPMFHMEHCVFCTVLSPGTNKSNCGRPCDVHDVKLRDRIGVEHVLHADVGCRNTLYNGNAQSGAEVVPALLERGVRRFRIEILRDAPEQELERLWTLYSQLIAGKTEGSSVWRSLRAENRVGVTRGTLEHPRNPLAIL